MPSNSILKPDPFLELRVHDLSLETGLTGLCAGYEGKRWRCEQLASHLIEWLPEFALSHKEREGLAAHNAVAMIAKAAKSVYTSEKYKNRGELGEILLHVAVRQAFNSEPAISKYFFKDSTNDTVKGFDAVHVVADKTSLELWLGEVKFYEKVQRAIADVKEELKLHTERDYLRSEFTTIVNKIDDQWPHADRLKRLLDRNRSLDEIFDRVCIPVLLTYNSTTIGAHSRVTEEFKNAFSEEVCTYHVEFVKKALEGKALPSGLRVHLFLFPMKDRAALVTAFDERLKSCQAIG